MISLVPITWDDDFPLIGLPGNLRKAPNTWMKPNTGVHAGTAMVAFPHEDNFDGPKLVNTWQWNHVPDDTKWSLTENPGQAAPAFAAGSEPLYRSQHAVHEAVRAGIILTVEVDASGMKEGDNAGLGVIQSPCASIGFVKTAEGLVLQEGVVHGWRRRRGGGATPPVPVIANGPDNPPSHVWLRLHINMDTDAVPIQLQHRRRASSPIWAARSWNRSAPTPRSRAFGRGCKL